MGLLGKIWVKLGLDNSEFNKEIKESQGAVSQFKNFMSGIGKAIIGAFSVSAIVNFAKASIKAYNESALALAKLENILKSTGNASGYTSQQLQSYAMQLQRVTKFEDDTTIAAMGVLASFKNIRGDVFKGVIKTAMDLSTVIGGDLQSNVYQLAKALERPAEGIQLLNRSTRAFSEAQIEDIKKLVAEGKTREAQMLALNTLNERFGGSAEAAADTAEGAWTRVANAVGNLMEKMGEASKSTKSFANTLASTLEFLGSDSGKITFWQKLGLILGSPQALNNMAKVSEQMNASRQAAENYANTAMKGIKSVEDAELKLLSIEGLKSEGWDLLREKLVAYLAEYKKVGATSDDNVTKSDAENKAIVGTIGWYKELIAEIDKKIEKTDVSNRVVLQALENEKAGLENQLKVWQMNSAEAAAYYKELEKIEKLRATQDTNKLKPVKGRESVDAKGAGSVAFGLPTDDMFASFYAEQVRQGEAAIEEVENQMERMEEMANQFNQAIARSISGGIENLVASLVATGKVDATAVVSALLMPFADLAIQLGEIAIAAGIGTEAIKKAFEGGGAASIAAGVALIALGSAVKGALGGLAARARGGNTSGGSYGVNPMSGGGMGSWTPSGNNFNINVSGILKGQDIYLAVEKTKANKNR